MKVSFVLKRADVAAQRYWTSQGTRSKAFWMNLALPGCMGGLVALTNLAFTVWGVSLASHLAVLSLLLPFFVLFASNERKWRHALHLRHFDLNTEVEVSEQGISIKDGMGTALTSWTDIKFVLQTPKYIILLCSNKTSIVVPKRAFGSPAVAKAFMGFALSRWQRAQLLPTNLSPPIAAP